MTYIYNQELIIKAGTEFFLSKMGYKGFYYPDNNNAVTLPHDITAKKVSWTCGDNNFSPYSINISEITMLNPSVNVIWINKE